MSVEQALGGYRVRGHQVERLGPGGKVVGAWPATPLEIRMWQLLTKPPATR